MCRRKKPHLDFKLFLHQIKYILNSIFHELLKLLILPKEPRVLSQGQGQMLFQDQGQMLSQGQGQTLSQGQGQTLFQGEGPDVVPGPGYPGAIYGDTHNMFNVKWESRGDCWLLKWLHASTPVLSLLFCLHFTALPSHLSGGCLPRGVRDTQVHIEAHPVEPRVSWGWGWSPPTVLCSAMTASFTGFSPCDA